MKIRIFDSREECLVAGAWAFIRYALNNPEGTIGLCTGSTTGPIHEMVADIYRKYPFDVSRLHTVNADEFLTPKGSPVTLTMRTTMKKDLFDALGIDEERGMLPDSTAEDGDAEALKYEERIKAVGGVGLQMLGVGPDAHLGFCLAGTSFDSVCHKRAVSPAIEEIIVNKYKFDRSMGPFYGMTMGLKTFMQGKEMLPIVCGASKAEAAEKAIFGPVTEEVPASILQLHPNCTWYMDREAAAGIIGRVNPDGTPMK